MGAERVLADWDQGHYPLPAGEKPRELKVPPQEMAPEVVERVGLVYSGVHEFRSKFVWSPDSRRVGLVDCLVDYRLRDDSQEAFDERGTQENFRCYVVDVGFDGSFRRSMLKGPVAWNVRLCWVDNRTLQVE